MAGLFFGLRGWPRMGRMLEHTGSTSLKVPGHLRTRRTHTTPHTDTTHTKGAGQWLQERKAGQKCRRKELEQGRLEQKLLAAITTQPCVDPKLAES